MLINAVKDVTSALGDLMQATKCASGKNMQHPAMHQLKDTAKVRIENHFNQSLNRYLSKQVEQGFVLSLVLMLAEC